MAQPHFCQHLLFKNTGIYPLKYSLTSVQLVQCCAALQLDTYFCAHFPSNLRSVLSLSSHRRKCHARARSNDQRGRCRRPRHFSRLAEDHPLHQLHHDGFPHPLRLGGPRIAPASVLEQSLHTRIRVAQVHQGQGVDRPRRVHGARRPAQPPPADLPARTRTDRPGPRVARARHGDLARQRPRVCHSPLWDGPMAAHRPHLVVYLPRGLGERKDLHGPADSLHRALPAL